MCGILAVEHRSSGVHFFNLEPGFVVTELMRKVHEDDRKLKLEAPSFLPCYFYHQGDHHRFLPILKENTAGDFVGEYGSAPPSVPAEVAVWLASHAESDR